MFTCIRPDGEGLATPPAVSRKAIAERSPESDAEVALKLPSSVSVVAKMTASDTPRPEKQQTNQFNSDASGHKPEMHESGC